MANVKVAEIKLPDDYIRSQIHAANVNDLANILAVRNGVDDVKKLEGKTVEQLEWWFDPVILVKNLTPKPEKPKKVKAKKGEKKEKIKAGARPKKWIPYEISDGGHRWVLARRLKIKEIPATIKTESDPVERFLLQYHASVGGNLRLDKNERDDSIRHLCADLGLKQRECAKRTGLDESSISRIMADKQRKKGPRKESSRKAAGFNDTEAGVSTGTQTPDAFVGRIQLLTEDFPKLRDPVTKFIHSVVSPEQAKTIAELLREIASVFDDNGR